MEMEAFLFPSSLYFFWNRTTSEPIRIDQEVTRHKLVALYRLTLKSVWRTSSELYSCMNLPQSAWAAVIRAQLKHVDTELLYNSRVPRSGTRGRSWRAASRWFREAESTNCCSSPSFPPPCTCSEEQREFQRDERCWHNTSVTHLHLFSILTFSLNNPSVGSDLAQYLRQLFDKLGLCGFWQQRIKGRGNLCLHVSFVFNLKNKHTRLSVLKPMKHF